MNTASDSGRQQNRGHEVPEGDSCSSAPASGDYAGIWVSQFRGSWQSRFVCEMSWSDLFHSLTKYSMDHHFATYALLI